MSDSSASAIAEMRRMLIDQQQTIVGLRSQLIDHRCVVVQTLARVELLENYAENAHGGFQRRYPSAAIFELRNGHGLVFRCLQHLEERKLVRRLRTTSTTKTLVIDQT
ncbi:hypothetical protein GPALN_013201 [Globodera pallida]|uniref:MarR family transcriptional regulator n=1 Tax=Globodera pallida TaxID=36090 RepID=A0A183CIB4_GLOPA|nr:hypothetical protein GPALN_013201 [Globodera pallida]